MQVFIAIILAIGSVSARGSGPYLPSGWKPQGPAFYLPSEVAKSTPSPVQEPQFPETEASGSEALREYGPPKLEEIVLNVNQGLPEVVTEQIFFVEVKNEEVAAIKESVDVEANTEQVAAIVQETSTATKSQEVAQTVEEQTTELSNEQTTAGAQALDTLEQVDVTSEAIPTEQDNKEAVTSAAGESVVPTAAEQGVISTAVVDEVLVPLGQQELIQDALPTATEEVVPTSVAAEVAVVTAEAAEEIVPVVAVEESIVPTTEAEQSTVPIAVVVEEIVSTAEAAGNVAPIATVEESIVPTDVVFDAADTAEKAENVVPAAETAEEVVSTVVIQEPVVPLSQQELVQDAIPTSRAEVIVDGVSGGVNNIADALTVLDNEVRAVEVLSSGNTAEISSTQETSGSLNQTPEGFLEYNAPGFAVYGPPKQEDLARLATEVTSENNDVRRRRFSPKFSSTKKH